MNGKERLTLAVQSIANGVTSVENGVNLIVLIFGDIYDEGRALVIASLNPPTVVKPEKEFDDNIVHYDFGGEG